MPILGKIMKMVEKSDSQMDGGWLMAQHPPPSLFGHTLHASFPGSGGLYGYAEQPVFLDHRDSCEMREDTP